MTHDFPLVDCHVHVGLTKYRPLEEYLPDMAATGVGAAVLVQHLGNTDNDYLARCRTGGPFAAIAIARDSDHATDLMSEGFHGLRLSPRGLEQEPGSDRVWKVLAEHEGVASVTGPFDDIVSPDFVELVARFPKVNFRLEHLGWFKYSDGAPSYPAFSRFLKLAELPNTTTTWSGFFVNSSCDYPYPDAEPFLRSSLDAFGADRIMWSGDWNRHGLEADTYAQAVSHIALLPFVNGRQRDAILGHTATRIFDLDPKA